MNDGWWMSFESVVERTDSRIIYSGFSVKHCKIIQKLWLFVPRGFFPLSGTFTIHDLGMPMNLSHLGRFCCWAINWNHLSFMLVMSVMSHLCKQINQGLVNVPFWGYWTSPSSSHYRPLIPNGWVMFNGDMTNDPCQLWFPLVLLIILVSSPSPPPSSFVEHLDSPQFPVSSAPTSGLSSQKRTSNHLRLKTTGFPCHRIAMNWDILGSFLAISGKLFSYRTHHFFHSNPFKSLFMILLNFAVLFSVFIFSPLAKNEKFVRPWPCLVLGGLPQGTCLSSIECEQLADDAHEGATFSLSPDKLTWLRKKTLLMIV